MAEEKKFFSKYQSRVDNIIKNLKSKEWKHRFDAITDLEQFVEEGVQYEAFMKQFDGVQIEIAKLVGAQVSDLRSELVRQACHCISLVSKELGENSRKFARVVFPILIDASDSRNVTIRGYATKCVPDVCQYTHHKSLLLNILDSMNRTKSRDLQERCLEYLKTCLAYWPFAEKYSEYADVVLEAILFGINGATPQMRNLGARAFWIFAGQFPDKRDAFLNSLDARTRRIVEKGKTIEEEEQEYSAATKIASVIKGHIQRKRFRKSVSFGKTLRPGQRVKIIGTNKRGITKYYGPLQGKDGTFVGVETDDPDDSHGDGTVNGQRYFVCPAKHAIFVRIPMLVPEDEPEDAEQEAAAVAAAAALSDDEDPTLPPIPKTPMFKLPTHDSKDNTSAGADDANRPRSLTDTPLADDDADSKATPRKHLTTSTSQSSAGSSQSLAAPSQTHARSLSIPAMNELTNLQREHKFHMTLMGEAFQKEMDLAQHQSSPTYLNDMIAVLTEIVDRTSFLKSKFQDYKRRLENEQLQKDDFLDQNDRFHDT